MKILIWGSIHSTYLQLTLTRSSDIYIPERSKVEGFHHQNHPNHRRWFRRSVVSWERWPSITPSNCLWIPSFFVAWSGGWWMVFQRKRKTLHPKNHGISKLVVWRSQDPAKNRSRPLYRRVQWFLGQEIFKSLLFIVCFGEGELLEQNRHPGNFVQPLLLQVFFGS